MTANSPNERDRRESPLSIRLPNELKAALDEARVETGNSLNREITRRLEASLREEDPEITALTFIAEELPRRINWLIGTDRDANRDFLLLFYRAAINALFDELKVETLTEKDHFQKMADAAAKKLVADIRGAAAKNDRTPDEQVFAAIAPGLGLDKEA
jgi:hypothetical protein